MEDGLRGKRNDERVSEKGKRVSVFLLSLRVKSELRNERKKGNENQEKVSKKKGKKEIEEKTRNKLKKKRERN